MNKIIKYGLLILQNKCFLVNRKKNTQLFLLPGGKPLPGERVNDCLAREFQEEHGCSLNRESIHFFGTFEDTAANEANTLVNIQLYQAEIIGIPQPSSEIVEQRWFGRDDDPALLSPIIKNKILPVLLKKKLLD